MEACNCGDSRPYEACCGRYLEGTDRPQLAEQLMRSRFTAYARGNLDYVVASELNADPEAVSNWMKQTRFLRLRVLSAQGGPDDDEGSVTFEADLETAGRAHTHRETSRFRKIDGNWIFIQGKQNPLRVEASAGRNDPCPCGSGKKFKKCCLR